MLIHEFHSKLGSRNDQSLLFDALRRLRLVKDLKSVATNAESGWILWTDATQDDDGSSLRFASAMA